MNTHEVAEYLRIKERKVYDLVRKKKIPCTRVSGKWLFPKKLIDKWLTLGIEGSDTSNRWAEEDKHDSIPPNVIAGSHDLLLDWSLLEINSNLALLGGGSVSGLDRFARGEALACTLHILDRKSGDYNISALKNVYNGSPPKDVVLIEWARREQGLILPPGNPQGISELFDLIKKDSRLLLRQSGSGSRMLYEYLADQAGIAHSQFNICNAVAKNETELGRAIADKKADVGIGLASVAKLFSLEFLPLFRERFDILIRRRDYFEKPFQQLMSLTKSENFFRQAREMCGYDISQNGKVHYNSM